MPQFDIASFYPQITFFAIIFLVFYVYLTKHILPLLSKNLKLNKRLIDLYNGFAKSSKRLKDINVLSYIYKPTQILSHSIYKEILILFHLQKFVSIITNAYISSLNWLLITQKTNANVRLFKLNRTYLNALNDIYS